MKKLVSLMLGIVAVFGLAACTEATIAAESYYVAIDINPSIEFIVDEEDNVVSFNLCNEDAEILVAGVDFIGMNVDEAVELFIELATEAGYIDVDSEDNAVLITVLGDEENAFVEQVRTRIKEKVGRFFVRNYIKGEILTDEFTQEDLIAQAEELGVTPGKLSLATLILNTETEETYTLDELLAMPVKDLVSIIRTYHEDSIKEYSQEQLNQFVQKRQELYDLHQERFNNYVNEHPELTEEQIDALCEQLQEKVQTITQEKWNERIENWKENNQNNQSEETPDTTSDSDQTSS